MNNPPIPSILDKIHQTQEKTSTKPGDFLSSIVGSQVVVKLNSGTEFRGRLTCLDGFLNLAMENTEEFVHGEFRQRYGDAFVRGNNGIEYAILPFYPV